MNHDDLKGLIPAVALGALDDEVEAALIHSHLRSCAECRSTLADFRALTDDLAYAVPALTAAARLSEDLRRRMAPASYARTRFSLAILLRRPALGVAFAALAFVLLIGSNLYWASRTGRAEQQIGALATLAQAPGLVLTAESGSSEARGILYRQADSSIALLCVYELPALPAGKTYQAWLIAGQQRVSGGTFQVTDDGFGVLLIRSPRQLREYDGLGITVEPSGGSPGPTSPRVLGVKL